MKTKTTLAAAFAAILAVTSLAGCQMDSRKQLLAMNDSQVALRSVQSRAFDTADRERTLRAIIATLQDLGFVIDRADATLGLVSATKLDNYALRITVTIRPRGESQLLVRANAQFNITPVDEPEPYQNFFTALERSMFLTAHAVD
ncbi:MAG: hypothetical protein ACE5LF_04675 [Alphaproteobacteria bacterium]